MKKSLLRLLCVTLCMVLMFGCVEAKADEKQDMRLIPIERLFRNYYYVKDTVPEDLLTQHREYIYLGDIFKAAEVKFIFGDQFLSDAVKYGVDGVNVYFYIDNDVLTAPGEAEFEITVEYEEHIGTGTFYLKVLDYNEYPLLTIKQRELALDVNPGNRLYAEDIQDDICEFHWDEIEEKVNYNENYKYQLRHGDCYFDNIVEGYNYETDEYLLYVADLVTGEKVGGITADYDESRNRYISVDEYGIYRLKLRSYQFSGNILFEAIVTIGGPRIVGGGSVIPGSQSQYNITGNTEGKTFTWSVEGENAEIDKETGLLTVDANAVYGSTLVIKATSNDGEEIRKTELLQSALNDVRVKSDEKTMCGFIVPAFPDWKLNIVETMLIFSNESKHTMAIISIGPVGENMYDCLCKDPDEARTLIGDLENEQETKWIEIDGYPARLVVFGRTDADVYQGSIAYLRDSVRLGINLIDSECPVTMADMEKLASFIGYDETQSLFTAADTVLSISAKDNPVAVTAGKNIQFTSAFANPESVNKNNNNDAVVWSVGKADSGEAVEGVSIDAKGQLKVDKSLAAPVDLQVKVASELFGTSATYNISAMPVVSKVTLDPAQLFFYVGTEDPQTVKASLEPASVPPVGLTWTPAKKDIVEITPVEDGVVSIKPLKAGKTDIAVKEPGGKNAKLTVNVVAPVESVELKVNGKPKAGGKVTVAAALAPKNVGNKAVQWSLDVGEEIATINEKGQLTIGKEVASGTKITVTCTALGAPAPVVGTVVVEIP